MMQVAAMPVAGEATAPPSQGQVFLIDDDEGFRQSTQWLLERRGFQVESFGNGRHFLAVLDTWPDAEPTGCVLLDVRMPGMTGLELQDALRQRGSLMPLIFMSASGSLSMAVGTMRKGAVDFLEKPLDDEVLFATLSSAMRRAQAPLMHASADAAAKTRVEQLTPRERQIAELVATGKLNKVIADVLGIGIKTVEWHRAHVMSKLKVRSVAELVQLMMHAR
jgi:two-component system, LuxR family, response regulator FixJ